MGLGKPPSQRCPERAAPLQCSQSRRSRPCCETPPSHDSLQLPQLVHGPHLPSTLQRIVLEGVIKSICKQSYLGKRCRHQLQYHFWVSSSSQQGSTCPWTLDGNGGSRQHHVDHHLALPRVRSVLLLILCLRKLGVRVPRCLLGSLVPLLSPHSLLCRQLISVPLIQLIYAYL